MRPLKYRPGANSEIQLAAVAAVEPARSLRNSSAGLALRANRAIHPESAFEISPRRWFIGEQLEELEGADCALAHALIVDNSLTGVKYFVLPVFSSKGVKYIIPFQKGRML